MHFTHMLDLTILLVVALVLIGVVAVVVHVMRGRN
jgi:hypothetical protein